MMGHKICFYGEIWLIIPKLSLLPLLIWSNGNSFCDFLFASLCDEALPKWELFYTASKSSDPDKKG